MGHSIPIPSSPLAPLNASMRFDTTSCCRFDMSFSIAMHQQAQRPSHGVRTSIFYVLMVDPGTGYHLFHINRFFVCSAFPISLPLFVDGYSPSFDLFVSLSWFLSLPETLSSKVSTMGRKT